MSTNYKTFLNQKEPTGGKWQDDKFPPTNNSLTGSRSENKTRLNLNEIEWKRANEIFPQPLLFENKINAENLTQGKIGDCYFLSSLVALSKYPGLITQIFFTKEYNPDGFYKLLLFIDGELQIVYIDDYFPCLKGTNIPYFAKPNNFEIWPMLLEKAWAKVNKGYANIINGWPIDIFKFLTGFSCEYLNLDEETEEHLWPTMRFLEKNNGIICLSTKSNQEVKEIGLIPDQTYNLIETIEYEDDTGNIINLCKLRNYWKKNDWKGEWSEKSDKLEKNLKLKGRKKNEDEFFISINDVMKYFCRIDMTQVICDGYTLFFNIKEKDIEGPQVYNFFLRTKGNVSISVLDKNFRFHPELKNISHPTSLVLVEYDPVLKIFKNIYCDFNCFDDCEKTRTLNSGFYVLWIYKISASAQAALPLKIRICSESKISIKHLGSDKDCEIIKSIIYNSVKYLKKDEIKDEIFYDYSNDFNGSGLAYRLVINPLSTKYQKWTVTFPKNNNYLLLPILNEEEKEESINFSVGPNDYAVVIAIKTNNYGSFCFNINSDVAQIGCREGEDPVQEKKISFDSYCTSDVSQIEPLSNKETKSLEEITKKEKFPVIDHFSILAEKYNINPAVKDGFLSLKPQEGNQNLGWVVINLKNGTYIGEADYLLPQGRGCMLYKSDGMSWIGYFDKGSKGNYGKLYNRDGILLYEGEYKNNIRNGNGTFYYPGGFKYIGEFENGIREGKGIFYWDDGTYWNGHFNKNEMNGEGIYFDGEDSFTVTYKNGDIVED